jgi:type III secretory pathway component EscR
MFRTLAVLSLIGSASAFAQSSKVAEDQKRLQGIWRVPFAMSPTGRAMICSVLIGAPVIDSNRSNRRPVAAPLIKDVADAWAKRQAVAKTSESSIRSVK